MTVWLEIDGVKRRVELGEAEADGAMVCTVDGVDLAVNARLLAPGVMSLVMADGRQFRCVLDGDAVVVDGWRHKFAVVDPRSLAARRGAGAGAAGPQALKAPMPGRVVRVLVKAGDVVVEKQAIVVIEAMKMQNELKSPKAGTVARILVGVGDTVASGDVLAVVE